HTNYPYLMSRPSLGPHALPSGERIREFFEQRAQNWDARKPLWDTEVVATASALAFNDAQTTKKLHPITRSALHRMWTLQRADGSWEGPKATCPPAEADDYYGVPIAARGAAVAPDGYAATPAARAGLARIASYFQRNAAPSLHHQMMRLWAAAHLDELMGP